MGMKGVACFSECGLYRYRLGRYWGSGPTIMWLMLNPSTADHVKDDATISRCIRFSVLWGYGSLWVGNLFALRATNPAALATVANPCGPENREHLRAMSDRACLIVAAWGAHSAAGERVVTRTMKVFDQHPVACLGTTRSGAPKHPLYLRADTKLQAWPPC